MVKSSLISWFLHPAGLKCKRPIERRSPLIALLLMALLLSACQLELAIPTPDPGQEPNNALVEAEPTEAPAEEPAEEPAAAPTEEPVEEPVEEPTEIPPTEIPPTSTPAQEPTSLPPTATPAPAPAEPIVTITTSSLRARSGPGTEYEILGAVSQGESFVISGQAYDCGWYQIQHPQLGIAWTSGSSDYVSSNGADCAQIPEAVIPAVPTAAPQVEPAPSADQGSDDQGNGDQGNDFPADKACYLFQNQLGPELNVTISRADGSNETTFKVPNKAEIPYCLWPGKYTVTVDAPPPWSELNGEINAVAGDHRYFPIRPGN